MSLQPLMEKNHLVQFFTDQNLTSAAKFRFTIWKSTLYFLFLYFSFVKFSL